MPVDTQQIMDEASKLGDLVAQHPAVARYKEARKAVESDPEANRLMADFDRQIESLSRQTQSGMPVTDAQQQQIKAIMEAEKPKMQPLMEQLRQERQQMNTLTESGAFDEAAVRAAAGKQAQTETDLAVERARVKSQIFAVLTPEQRTKAQEMKKNFEGRHGRWGHEKGAAAGQQPGAPGEF